MIPSKYLIFLLLFLPAVMVAQKDESQKDPVEDKYEWRIRQQTLYGVYIPKDLNDVILELTKKTDEPSKRKFKSMSEEDAASKLFFSLGRWMTHNWSLYEGSRLSKYMQDMGIHHPDDMVRFFIIAFHRSVNREPLEIKELIQRFQKKEEVEKEKRQEKGAVISEERRKVTQPPADTSRQ